MPWQVDHRYTRTELQGLYPGLALHDAVRLAGDELGVVLLRKNMPGYVNWFENRDLVMEVRKASRAHNDLLKRAGITKVLFWSETGGDYLCLGPMRFEGETPSSAGMGPIFRFQILDPAATIPAR
jgi:hypothetical protein